MPGRTYTGPRGDDVVPCDECGERHLTHVGNQACAGHRRYDRATYVKGQPRKPLPKPVACRKPPLVGAAVCREHGGAAEQIKTAGRQRVAQADAEKIMRRFGGPIDTTPSEALLDTVKWTAGYVGWLRDKVAGLDETAPDGETADERRRRDEKALTQRSTQTGKQEASAWVDLLGTWHDKLVKVCAEAIRAGIEERRVRLAEQQGAMVADVIRKILDDLDLTPDQAAKAGDVVPLRLRSLAS